jgi:hypothetical protein
MSGVNGGGLLRHTADGWTVEQWALDWPQETLLLVPPGGSAYEDYFGEMFGGGTWRRCEFTKVFVTSGIVAWGFSPTGNSLIMVVSGLLLIFSRREAFHDVDPEIS